MRDKAIGEIAEILFPLAERVIVTRADNPRSASPEEVRDAAVRAQAEIELAADVVSAVERAQELAFSGELVADGVSRASLGGQPGAAVSTCAVVVITGSIYVVGEAMRALRAGGDGE
jgi:dihydrofolate synthase/folylpolyglutamate synthase